MKNAFLRTEMMDVKTIIATENTLKSFLNKFAFSFSYARWRWVRRRRRYKQCLQLSL